MRACTYPECARRFCEHCLTVHMSEETLEGVDADTEWLCPICRKVCCCAVQSCNKTHRHCKAYRYRLRRAELAAKRGPSTSTSAAQTPRDHVASMGVSAPPQLSSLRAALEAGILAANASAEWEAAGAGGGLMHEVGAGGLLIQAAKSAAAAASSSKSGGGEGERVGMGWSDIKKSVEASRSSKQAADADSNSGVCVYGVGTSRIHMSKKWLQRWLRVRCEVFGGGSPSSSAPLFSFAHLAFPPPPAN
jgi:hypothetical protein